MVEERGAVSFYEDFKAQEPARQLLKICFSEACHAFNSRDLLRFFEDRFCEMPLENKD